MSLIDETREIVKFIEDSGKKSVITENAMHCRLSACNNLFGVLREGETNADFILKNLPLLVGRFRKKNPTITKNTLKVYKSRVKSSVEDYLAWSRDPIGWEHEMMTREPAPKKEAVAAAPRVKSRKREAAVSGPAAPSVGAKGERRISFPIRSDFDIELVIPEDGLSARELMRLQLFLHSFCKDVGANDDSPAPWVTAPPSRH